MVSHIDIVHGTQEVWWCNLWLWLLAVIYMQVLVSRFELLIESLILYLTDK